MLRESTLTKKSDQQPVDSLVGIIQTLAAPAVDWLPVVLAMKRAVGPREGFWLWANQSPLNAGLAIKLREWQLAIRARLVQGQASGATYDSRRGYLAPMDSYCPPQTEQPSANKVLSLHGPPVQRGCMALRLGNRPTSGAQFLHPRTEVEQHLVISI